MSRVPGSSARCAMSMACWSGFSSLTGGRVGRSLPLAHLSHEEAAAWTDPALPHGELPLAVHRPPQRQQAAIALVEGTGPKPFLLCQRRGQVVVGAAGGQFASSPQTLQHTLSVLAAELGTQTVEFFPDAGAISNRQVMRQYRRTWKLLRQCGYQVRVAWWGQDTKAAPDIDELEALDERTPLTVVDHRATGGTGAPSSRLADAYPDTTATVAVASSRRCRTATGVRGTRPEPGGVRSRRSSVDLAAGGGAGLSVCAGPIPRRHRQEF
jgi:hypothetical protein